MNSLCEACKAECCKWVDIQIQLTGREDLHWMNVRGTVVQEDGKTFWRIYSPCKHLSKEGRCNIYGTRPQSCKDYEVEGPPCNNIRRFAGNLTIK